MDLNEKDLCSNPTVLFLALGITALCILALILTGATFYYRYRYEIKVWLFANNIFLSFVTEDELDRDKIYDAFISFAHQDEQFFVEELLPVLEDEQKYKLCFHMRDFAPGEMILTQIYDSVEQSRRTIILLSKHFLRSVWGKIEFQTAHQKALSEGRSRVIVILFDDTTIDDIEDGELKAYLKMNTYVKWGDPWFWRKLHYAMPHSHKLRPKPARSNNYTRNQQHFNEALKKLDRLDLIPNGVNVSPNVVESTPPAEIVLNPLVLKNVCMNGVVANSKLEMNQV